MDWTLTSGKRRREATLSPNKIIWSLSELKERLANGGGRRTAEGGTSGVYWTQEGWSDPLHMEGNNLHIKALCPYCGVLAIFCNREDAQIVTEALLGATGTTHVFVHFPPGATISVEGGQSVVWFNSAVKPSFCCQLPTLSGVTWLVSSQQCGRR